MEASVDRISQPVAAFFDLDKTVISKSSTLAFGRPFYQYGLITRGAALRCMTGHLAYRMVGASHGQMERIRDWATGLCCGWPVDRVREIVARHLDEVIVPYIYAEARALIAAHQAAGRDVIIVSTSGHEVVDPIARLLGADAVIATRMRVESGCYSGQLEFYAYGEAKAARIRELAAERGYRLRGLPRLQRLGDRPAAAAGRRPPARGESGPDPAPGRATAGLAGAEVHGRLESPAQGQVAARTRQYYKSITLRSFQARQFDVERNHGPRTSGHGSRAPTRDQPREACRGRPGHRRCARTGAPGEPLPRRRRCTLGNPA